MIKLPEANKKEAYQKIVSYLESKGFECLDYSEINYGLQFKVKNGSEDIGYIRIYESKKGVSLDLSQFRSTEIEQKIMSDLYNSLPSANEGLKVSLPRIYYIREPEFVERLKKEILSRFDSIKEAKPRDVQYFFLQANGITITMFKSGKLLIQGALNKYNSSLLNVIDKLYGEESAHTIIRHITPLLRTKDVKQFEAEYKNIRPNLDKYLSSDLYEYLYPNDKIDLQDGITLLEWSKNNKIQFKNYIILVRNFSIVFEGFLIKLFIDGGLIDEEKYEQNSREARIGELVSIQNDGTSTFSKKFENYYQRKYPYLKEQLPSLWQECRNKYLHSDVYSQHKLDNLEQAEGKIHTILDCMKKCYEVLAAGKTKSLESNEDDLEKIACIGTDESGKGDYFGPLVVGGVLVETQEQLKELHSLGVTDSKKLSDKQIKYLAPKIKSICKCDQVIIGPSKYNELYSRFKNLNKLLAWGHARVLENLLKRGHCDYAIADQFGDESYILNALMSQGKKIKLEQRPRAEENIVVAAASILAREKFIGHIEKMSLEFGLKFPLGASPSVVAVAKQFVSKYGEGRLNEVVKLHFKTTDQIIC